MSINKLVNKTTVLIRSNRRQIKQQMLADEERNALAEKEKSFQDAAFIGMGAERMKRKYEE
ncbi:hypothetical protein P7D06_29550, partial [Bacillus mobilis]|uniref:hypothetical protein n=1 Tax=Bacillus mobilis TaxID=2026190 RepID=UPI00240CE613